MLACVNQGKGNQFIDCIIVQLEIHFYLPKQIIMILLENSAQAQVGRGSVAERFASVHSVLS